MGMRLCGMQVYLPNEKRYLLRDKLWGRTLTRSNIEQALELVRDQWTLISLWQEFLLSGYYPSALVLFQWHLRPDGSARKSSCQAAKAGGCGRISLIRISRALLALGAD